MENTFLAKITVYTVLEFNAYFVFGYEERPMQDKLEKASTHKSAKTHTECDPDLWSFDREISYFQDSAK